MFAAESRATSMMINNNLFGRFQHMYCVGIFFMFYFSLFIFVVILKFLVLQAVKNNESNPSHK